jgi:hypothetical protein
MHLGELRKDRAVLLCRSYNNDLGSHPVGQPHTKNFENLAVCDRRLFLPISWAKKKRLDIEPALLLFPLTELISSQF